MDRGRNIKEKVKTQQGEKDEVKKDAELRKRKNTLCSLSLIKLGSYLFSELVGRISEFANETRQFCRTEECF